MIYILYILIFMFINRVKLITNSKSVALKILNKRSNRHITTGKLYYSVISRVNNLIIIFLIDNLIVINMVSNVLIISIVSKGILYIYYIRYIIYIIYKGIFYIYYIRYIIYILYKGILYFIVLRK